jgi:uncharacterized protein (TIGR02246 family)
MDAYHQAALESRRFTTFQPDTTREEDVQAKSAVIAEGLVERWVDAWNRADATAFGQCYWPDAEVVNPAGGIASGRTAIEQDAAAIWAGLSPVIRFTGSVRKVQQLGPDFLMVDFDLSVSGGGALTRIAAGAVDSGPAIRAHMKHVLANRDGTWRTLAAQGTFNAQNPPSMGIPLFVPQSIPPPAFCRPYFSVLLDRVEGLRPSRA